MRDADLLAEAVVAAGSAAFALAAPNPDERQQGQQCVVEVRAFPKVRGVGRNRQVREGRDVAGRGRFRPFDRGRDCFVAGGHDSSVISRYSVYSANQVMTTTAAINRISKSRTTVSILVVDHRRFAVRSDEWPQPISGAYSGQSTRVAVATYVPTWLSDQPIIPRSRAT